MMLPINFFIYVYCPFCQLRSLKLETEICKNNATQLSRFMVLSWFCLVCFLIFKVRNEVEMRKKIKQLEEEIKRSQQIVIGKDKDKIKVLEESLIRATLEKVSF